MLRLADEERWPVSAMVNICVLVDENDDKEDIDLNGMQCLIACAIIVVVEVEVEVEAEVGIQDKQHEDVACMVCIACDCGEAL